jgi:hypothetical protein
MKYCSVMVAIQHRAGVTAANTVNVKQRDLIDFGAFQNSTFTHRTTSQTGADQNASRQQPLQARASNSL